MLVCTKRSDTRKGLTGWKPLDVEGSSTGQPHNGIIAQSFQPAGLTGLNLRRRDLALHQFDARLIKKWLSSKLIRKSCDSFITERVAFTKPLNKKITCECPSRTSCKISSTCLYLLGQNTVFPAIFLNDRLTNPPLPKMMSLPLVSPELHQHCTNQA